MQDNLPRLDPSSSTRVAASTARSAVDAQTETDITRGRGPGANPTDAEPPPTVKGKGTRSKAVNVLRSIFRRKDDHARVDTGADTGIRMETMARRAGSEWVTLPLMIDGKMTDVVTEIWKPAGDGPFPVVLFLHGRPAPSLKHDVSVLVHEQEVPYWQEKGAAFVIPFRPGYGPTEGPDREGVHVGPSSTVDVAHQSNQVVPIALGVHAWLREQPWVDGARFVIAGRSVGGLASLAMARHELPGLLGVINFAGVSLSNLKTKTPCRDPREVERAVTEFGQSARVPSLWLYAPNDSTCAVTDPPLWHAAFQRGGSDAQFFAAPAVPGADGHMLLRNPQLWGATADEFLARIGFA